MLKVWNVLLVDARVLSRALRDVPDPLGRRQLDPLVHAEPARRVVPRLHLPDRDRLARCSSSSRLPLLRSKTRLESLVSREATFLYNNLLLVALCLTILWGVVFPILSEAVRGEQITVGAPVLQLLPAHLRAAAAPADGDRAARRLAARVAALARPELRLAGRDRARRRASCSSCSARARPGSGSLAYTFSAFVLGSIGYEFVRGTRARRALTGGLVARGVLELVARNRRRYGGYIVHAAIVLLAIGIVGSSAYDTVRERTLSPGQTMAVGHYDLTYQRLVQRRGRERRPRSARSSTSARTANSLGTLEAGKNHYRAEDQVSNEVGIRSDYLTGEDLFVITDQINPNGTIVFKVLVKPLVNLIWLAGLVFLIGSLVALWPSAAEQRRLADALPRAARRCARA